MSGVKARQADFSTIRVSNPSMLTGDWRSLNDCPVPPDRMLYSVRRLWETAGEFGLLGFRPWKGRRKLAGGGAKRNHRLAANNFRALEGRRTNVGPTPLQGAIVK